MKQKWYNTRNFILGAILGSVFLAVAADQVMRQDNLILGNPTSNTDKKIEFNTGDAGANKKIILNDTSKNATFNVNEITFGDGVLTEKKIIQDVGAGANNPFLLFDDTDSKWKFSNDGLIEKAIGSGGGGGSGINFLANNNADFEAGNPPDNWSNAGGVLTAITAGRLFDEQSAQWDSNALSQTLSSVLIPIDPAYSGAIGQTCSASVYYKAPNIVAGDIEFRVVNQSSVSIFELPLNPTPVGETQIAKAYFDCPPSGDSIRVQFVSTVADANPIILDNVFMGTGDTLLVGDSSAFIAQKELTGPSGGTPCIPKIVAGAGPVLFPSPIPIDADCNAPVSQGLNTNLDKSLIIEVPNMPAGRYKADFQGVFEANGATNQAQCHFDLRWNDDNSTANSGIQVYDNSTLTYSNRLNSLHSSYEHSGGALKVEVVSGFSASQDVLDECRVEANLNGQRGSRLTVFRFPSGPQEALNLATVGKRWEGHIDVSGASFLALGAGVTDLPFDSPSLVLTNIQGDAFITCASGTSPTGTTCSGGNENLGLAIKPIEAGVHNMCFDFTSKIDVVNNQGVFNTFYVKKVDPSTGAIIKNYDVQKSTQMRFSGTTTINYASTVDLCVEDYLSAGTLHAFKIYHSNNLIGAAPSFNGITEGLAPLTDVIMSFKIENKSAQQPSPVFTQLNNELGERAKLPGETAVKMCAFSVTPGGASLNSQIGGCVQSVTSDGTGQGDVTFVPSFWNSNPICSCAGLNNVSYEVINLSYSTPTSASILDMRTYSNVNEGNLNRGVHCTCTAID